MQGELPLYEAVYARRTRNLVAQPSHGAVINSDQPLEVSCYEPSAPISILAPDSSIVRCSPSRNSILGAQSNSS